MLPKGLLKEYSQVLSLMMRFLDMFIVLLAAYLSFFIKFHHFNMPPDLLIAILIGQLLLVLCLSFSQFYTSMRGKSLLATSLDLLQIICFWSLLLSGLAFLTKTGDLFSRVWFLYWASLTFVFLVLYRIGLIQCLRFMRKQGLNERRVIIFGAGELGSKFAGTVQQALWTGFKIISFLDDFIDQKPKLIHNIPVCDTPNNLCDYLKAQTIDEFWIALPLKADERVKAILHELRHFNVTIRYVLDIFDLNLLNHSISDVAGFPVLDISSTPMIGINRYIKACEDRLLALFILIIISPVLLMIAIGVKMNSRGPIFFKQKRMGWDGRVIKVYKFRTMIQHHEQNGQLTQAKANDKRVTRFGKFLRRTSLDELPQFLNVLQGRMSIVGPRPHALCHNEFYKDSVHAYMQRHRVKPGITGWAQVNGWRGETDQLNKMAKRIEYDLYYINNWSLKFDIKIILLTIFLGFVNRNAY